MEPIPKVPQIDGLHVTPEPSGRLWVFFFYHPNNVDRIKTIPGRRWHTEEKCWSIPYTSEAISTLERLCCTKSLN